DIVRMHYSLSTAAPTPVPYMLSLRDALPIFPALPGPGADGARRHQVDPHPAGPGVAGEGPGEGHQPGLGGAVGVVAEVLETVDRADAHHGAPAGGGEVRQGGAAAAVGTDEGDVEVGGPVLVLAVLEAGP